MKAYEALALGRHLIRPRAGVVLTEDRTEGCALGMMLSGGGTEAYYGEIANWLTTAHAEYPCSCGHPKMTQSLQGIVTHIFDYHIAGGSYNWNLDQLIDWLRAQEPEMKAEVKETIECTEETRALVAHS